MSLASRDFKSQGIEKKKAFKKKQRRKWSFLLFGGTIILSFIFWGQTKFRQVWENLFQTAVYHIENPLVEKEESSVKPSFQIENVVEAEQQILNATNNLMGTYGIYYYDLVENQSFGINEQQIFTAASVIKLPIMVSLYQYVEAGKLTENQIYKLKSEDIIDFGTGQMRYQKPGTEYTYGQLVELCGQYSDNTAAFVLEKIIGRSKIQNYLNSLGMKNTILADNTTTPKQMGDFLVMLHQGKLLNQEHSQKIYTSLTNTEYEDRIPKGIPDNIQVAHKIGNESQVYNDCGIVFSQSPYVLCLLSLGVKEAEALKVLPEISSLVWQYNQN
jgi:beta-lactamase class A